MIKVDTQTQFHWKKGQEIGFISYNHVLKSVFGQPAVQENWNEQVSEGRQNHLIGKKKRLNFLQFNEFCDTAVTHNTEFVAPLFRSTAAPLMNL